MSQLFFFVTAKCLSYARNIGYTCKLSKSVVVLFNQTDSFYSTKLDLPSLIDLEFHSS